MDCKLPIFLITIDTEGDNIWARPNNVTTNNAAFLPRFQALCEKYNLKPTYLVNYEMANSFQFQEVGKDIVERNVGEIGMHLHPWNMPPEFSLTNNDFFNQPFLIQYPEEIMRDKISLMTNILEKRFQCKIVSHRAGRWAFNETYAKLLIENGYKIDCSVTPNISWSKTVGDPSKKGGSDYSKFPSYAYFLNEDNILSAGPSDLLEIPMTISRYNYNSALLKLHHLSNCNIVFKKAFSLLFPPVTWLRPNGKNIKFIKKIMKDAVADKKEYVEFMLHSSELMPGGSPTFPDHKSIEKLYNDLEEIFSFASNIFQGHTLHEFYLKKQADR